MCLTVGSYNDAPVFDLNGKLSYHMHIMAFTFSFAPTVIFVLISLRYVNTDNNERQLLANRVIVEVSCQQRGIQRR